MQRRAQAHPFLSQPLLPPQFTGLVFSFPRWATPSQKRLEQQDEPFGAGGALQLLVAAAPKESNRHPWLTLLVPNKLQSFTLATAM